MNHAARLLCLITLIGTPAWAQGSGQASQKPDMALLFKTIWRVTKADPQPFHGSIEIFLPNGTLLGTSCGEPYRVALWTRDNRDPFMLHITEDQREVSTLKITKLTRTTLQLQKKLTRSTETQSETLTAVTVEFVCPDLPK